MAWFAHVEWVNHRLLWRPKRQILHNSNWYMVHDYGWEHNIDHHYARTVILRTPNQQSKKEVLEGWGVRLRNQERSGHKCINLWTCPSPVKSTSWYMKLSVSSGAPFSYKACHQKEASHEHSNVLLQPTVQKMNVILMSPNLNNLLCTFAITRSS